MKNITSYLLIVFTLFGSQLAQAELSCDDPSLKVKLSDLKYVGADLKSLLENPGACKVVRPADTDGEGNTKCKKYGVAALNPGNPQYIGSGYGTSTDNELNYYFCVAMSKKDMCDQRKAALGSTMDIVWSGRDNRNNGDCLCGRKGEVSAKNVICPADPTPLQTGESTGCGLANSKKNEAGKCVCIYDENMEAKVPAICPTERKKVVTEAVDDHDFDECFADIKAAKDACSEKGQAAIDQCSKDAPAANKNISEAQRVLSIGLDAIVAKNAGTGALESCIKMSAAGTGAIEALKLFQNTCRKELESCKKSCEDVKTYSQEDTSKMASACKAKFDEKYQGNPEKKWSAEHEARFTTLANEYKDGAATAEKFCKGDAQVADNEMNDTLQKMAASVQKAYVCQCQLTSASTQESCESVMNPLTCLNNPNQSGCAYSSIGCAPGSTKPGCHVVTGNSNVSGLAAPPSGFAGGFTSSGGGASSKVQIGDGDFSGLFDETRPIASATPTVDNGSPFGSAQASGGMGGGGGGGGSSDGASGGGSGEGSEKSGISGFFQNARGAIANMFGSSSAGKGTTVKKSDNKAFKNDVNGFRPKVAVRGMANTNEFGGKNRDIWKTMNERYNDQYHTFITVENPPK